MRLHRPTGHPALRKGLDLDTFAGLPHVRFSHSPDPGEEVDDALARCNRERRVAFVMPSFYALVLAVAHSDLLAVVPEGVAQVMMLQEPIGIHPVPLELSAWPISVAWTKGGDQDPASAGFGDCFCKLYAVPAPEPCLVAAHGQRLARDSVHGAGSDRLDTTSRIIARRRLTSSRLRAISRRACDSKSHTDVSTVPAEFIKIGHVLRSVAG